MAFPMGHPAGALPGQADTVLQEYSAMLELAGAPGAAPSTRCDADGGRRPPPRSPLP